MNDTPAPDDGPARAPGEGRPRKRDDGYGRGREETSGSRDAAARLGQSTPRTRRAFPASSPMLSAAAASWPRGRDVVVA